MSDILKGRAPFLTLLALKNGAKHGYDIAAFIKEKGGGFFSVSFGSLYPILHNLEKDGLIKGSWESVSESKNKKVYKLTSKGLKELEQETSHVRGLINVFSEMLRG
jgi:DNA-binding PadR family transcriptional regulator